MLWGETPETAPSAAAPADATCLACHGEKGLEGTSRRGKKMDLFFDAEVFQDSVHKGFSCTTCHSGAKSFEEVPHNEGRPLTLRCNECHAAQAQEYGRSVHGRLQKEGDLEAATCGNCHGSHNILPPADRRSTVNKFNLSTTCARCHKGG